MAIVKRSKTGIINFPRYPSKYDLKIESDTKYVSKEYYQIYRSANIDVNKKPDFDHAAVPLLFIIN